MTSTPPLTMSSASKEAILSRFDFLTISQQRLCWRFITTGTALVFLMNLKKATDWDIHLLISLFTTNDAINLYFIKFITGTQLVGDTSTDFKTFPTRV